MKLFVDEDTGPGIAKALKAVGVGNIDFVGKNRRIQKGDSDERWIKYVGETGALALSRNAAILRLAAERELIIQAKAGIVFLPAGLSAMQLLLLVLRRWSWLERIDMETPRPFAYTLSKGGRATQEPLERLGG